MRPANADDHAVLQPPETQRAVVTWCISEQRVTGRDSRRTPLPHSFHELTMLRTTLIAPLAAAATLIALAACASAGATPPPAPAPMSPAVASAPAARAITADSVDPVTNTVLRGSAPGTRAARPDRQLLTRDEIRSTQFTNAFEVVRALRGNWLRLRSADSFGKSSVLQVYLDMQRLNGGVEELRLMQPANIASIRFMDPIQASARWGMDHGAGAILVTTAKP